MATIAEKLQIVAEQKQAIKSALESQGKEPTDALSTYAGLIDGLENPERVEYTVTVDGVNKAYAQLYGQQKVKLTATANDIRANTSAITDKGFTEGQKDIPAYHTETGIKAILAGNPVQLTLDKYDYTKIQVTVAKYSNSMSESVEVVATTVNDATYKAGTNNKLADITKNDSTQTISLGITAEVNSVLRYFIMREE